MAYEHRDRDRDHHPHHAHAMYQHQHGFEGRKQKRPTTDYGTSMVQWIRHRRRGQARMERERPSPSYMIDMMPPPSRVDRPADSIPSKHMHSSLNKIKHPINVVKWNPDGRRLLTGSSSGEFTLWNGMGFNFETIMSAHESAIRAVAWSHSDDWLLSSDQNGMVKYWQSNFNNLNSFQAHEAPVRDLSFAPTDAKFVTASDDATLKIWDFGKGTEVSTLTGHNWDAKSVDWHPTKGLLASGSKDHTVKLWDPRTGKCLTSLRGHKNNVVSKVLFDPIRGNLLASAGFETTARVFDLRMMRDALLLKGHDEDVTTLTWHPIHHSLLTTATKNGCIQHYLLDEPNLPEGTPPTKSPYDSPDPSSAPAQSIYPAHRVRYAHEMSVWSLDWHPLGHILASGSADRVTRFWSRARPGETECFHDRYHLGDAAAKAHGAWTSNKTRHVLRDEEEEGDDDQEALVDQKMPTRQLVPGLPGIAAALKDGTSVGGAQTQPLPIFPGMAMAPPPMQPPHLALPGMPSPPFGLIPPGLDPNKLSQAEIQKLLAGRAPPVLPLGQGQPGFPVPPPGFTFGQNGMPIPPPGFQSLPQTFTPPPGSGGEQGIRRRAPLLSQEESLKEEQKRGNWKNAR